MTRMMVGGSTVTKMAGQNQFSPEVASWGNKRVVQWYGDMIKMGWTAEAQILGMDREGIDVAFVYPSQVINILANDDISPELALAIAKTYNDWLGEFVSYDPARLVHIAAVPQQNPKGAVEEVRRCAMEFGSRGVVIRGETHRGRFLDDPIYEELWGELERLSITVGMHHSSHSLVPTLGAHRFSTRFQSATVSHPMEQMSSMVALIGSGVLEHHPKLRVVFLESGAGWLPYMLYRFDEQYEQLSFEAPWLKMKPSDYFRRQCWIAVEPDEPHINMVADYLGEDYTVISSDFPHIDHPPGGLKEFAERTDVRKSVKRKTFWDNTMRLYGM